MRSGLKSGNANFDEKTGQKGPVSVMAITTYNKIDSGHKEPGNEEKGAKNPAEPTSQVNGDKAAENPAKTAKPRIVVAGSSLFAANKSYKLQGNGDLFMNSVSWLAEDENLIAIRPKSSKSQPIVLTGNESLVILVVPVVLLPLSWIIVGVVVYLYRRRTVTA